MRAVEERECYLVEAVLPRVCSFLDMLAKLRFPNWVVIRVRSNSQVLAVLFFGVGLVILQMKIDCL